MNKFTFFFALLVPFQSYGDCIVRGYSEKDGPPLYKLESCSLANEIIDSQLIDEPFAQPTEEDKAILVVPANATAKTLLSDNGEYWHYSGLCSDLPLNKVVSIQNESHCSDLGTTLHLLLGDITIKSANEQKLYGDDRSGITIYSYQTETPNKNSLNETAGLVEINNIKVINETSDQVEFSLTYTYNYKVPVEQVRIFLGVGMDYFRANYIQAKEGTHTANITVRLDSNRLKEKTGASENTSSYIWVSFDQYAPEKYEGWFYKSEFYFPKLWRMKT